MGRITAAIILKPIRSLASLMQQLSIDRASGAAPLPALPPHDPIHQLVSTFNTMATQVHEGVQKQKTFIMNASHELKTPIARAASELDIAKLEINSGDTKKLQSLLESAQQELLSVNTIIDVLLQAARLRQVSLNRTKVTLNPLISKELTHFSDEIAQKHLAVELPPRDLNVSMNESLLTLLIRNCLSNAVRYNIKYGNLTITTETKGQTVAIIIKNSAVKTATSSVNAESTANINSHKLGTIIIANLCELGQCEYTVETTNHSYMVTISGLPIVTSVA